MSIPAVRHLRGTLRLVLVSIVVCGPGFSAGAQTDPCLEWVIPVTVMTEGGFAHDAPIKATFRASADGKPVTIEAAAPYHGARRIVIVLDTSGSMATTGQVSLGSVLAHDLIVSATSGDSVALLTFSMVVEDEVDFQQGREASLRKTNELLERNWNRVKGFRKTALMDALMSALDMMSPARIGDAIYLVSDGEDNASRVSLPQLMEALESGPVRCYCVAAIAPAELRDPSAWEAEGPALLAKFADETGGAFVSLEPTVSDLAVPGRGKGAKFSAATAAAIAHATKSMLWAIDNFYEVRFALSAPIHHPGHFKLEAVDESGRKLKQIELLYPRRLAPCVTQAPN